MFYFCDIVYVVLGSIFLLLNVLCDILGYSSIMLIIIWVRGLFWSVFGDPEALLQAFCLLYFSYILRKLLEV